MRGCEKAVERVWYREGCIYQLLGYAIVYYLNSVCMMLSDVLVLGVIVVL